MNREELAWAAGFFDGEGTTYSNPKIRSIAVQVPNADLELLKRFQSAVGGLGTIGGPYSPSSAKNVLTKKDMYKWWACNFEHAQAVIAMLWPFLGSYKRAQAKTELAEALELRRMPAQERIDARPKIDRLCRKGLHYLTVLSNGRTYCSTCQWEKEKQRKELINV